MTIKLHCFGESGNAYKAALALELSGLDWEPVKVDFFGGETIFILGGNTNFDSFAELQAIAADAGGNVIFDFGGGNTLTLVGVNLADLPSSTFIFEGPLFAEPLNDPDAFAADITDVFDMDALI